MQHIFHKSGYNYPKRRDVNEMTKMFSGEEGIAGAVGTLSLPTIRGTVDLSPLGVIHQRQRKIMNPAFSATQLRTFLTLFQDIGMKVCTQKGHVNHSC